jgi:hypothetical protein
MSRPAGQPDEMVITAGMDVQAAHLAEAKHRQDPAGQPSVRTAVLPVARFCRPRHHSGPGTVDEVPRAGPRRAALRSRNQGYGQYLPDRAVGCRARSPATPATVGRNEHGSTFPWSTPISAGPLLRLRRECRGTAHSMRRWDSDPLAPARPADGQMSRNFSDRLAECRLARLASKR